MGTFTPTPNESYKAYIERLRAKAAEPGVEGLITTTYNRIWAESKPETDEEQAAIEPETVDELEDQFGDLTADLVDLVIFRNLPDEDKDYPVVDLDLLAQHIGWVPLMNHVRQTWQRVLASHCTDEAVSRMLDGMLDETRKMAAELEAARVKSAA